MSKRAKMEQEEELECPICTEHLLPPVYQCHEGHLLCKTCIEKTGSICPTCKDQMPAKRIRNRAIEDIIRSRMHPCENYDDGCRERLKYDAVDNHKIDCFYSSHPFCKFLKLDNCSRPVQMMKDLKEHLKTEHRVKWLGESFRGERFKMMDKIPEMGAKSKPTWGAFSLIGTPNVPPLFVLVKVWHRKNQTLWVPYMIGSRETANRHQCKITLTGKVKMSWKGVCRHLESTKADVHSSFTVSTQCLRGIVLEDRQNNSYEITVRVSSFRAAARN